MWYQNKRVLAAKKAVNTLRLNLLENANLGEVIKLSNEIIEKDWTLQDCMLKETIIFRELGKTSWQSFCRFGSKRNATKGLILYWIEKNAISLDEQAFYISEQYGLEILPDELANFILNHDKGKSMYEPLQEIETMKKAFKNITGFNWNYKFVKENILPNPVYQYQLTNEEYPF